jgi:citrate synthase
MWLASDEALRRLQVKPQTLYANVSRGRIKARPDPADPRRSLYNSDDIDRLARRAPGRSRDATVATEAIAWGEPVLSSAVSTVIGGRLYYRGRDAIELSRTASFEEVAALLWGGFPPAAHADIAVTPSMAAAFAALASRAAVDPPSSGRGAAALRQDASATLGCLASALLGAGGGPLHLRLAARYERSAAGDDLRRALVLLADHELNASTFAVRVTVSTGASLAAGALTGLAALSGPMLGLAARAVAALADEFDDHRDPAGILRDWLGEGRHVPGFGHRLYPAGDIRATELLVHLDLPPAYVRLRQAADEVLGEAPNVDFALAALAQVHDLPHEAPLTIFALARSVGWLAHMLEQSASGQLIRPRARYTGPTP